MYYVYIILSEVQPEQRYVGFTANLKQRLKPIIQVNLNTQQNTNLGSYLII